MYTNPKTNKSKIPVKSVTKTPFGSKVFLENKSKRNQKSKPTNTRQQENPPDKKQQDSGHEHNDHYALKYA